MIIIFLVIGGVLLAYNYYTPTENNHWENELGSVDKIIYGNPHASCEIVIITGIHPREKLAIEPEIESAKQFAQTHDVKLTTYQVNVTKNATVYQLSRDNGESLVHDYVVPDINKTHAKAVIISHSHIKGYGEGFYLATPAMDDESVNIADKVDNMSDFNYYTTQKNKSFESTSAKLVSKPIADAGYPTFVYEIPENITEQDSTNKTLELLEMIFNIVK